MNQYRCTAVLSDCGKYRYELSRAWNGIEDPRFMAFIMLNPSTADASKDDPTIRSCVRIARHNGCNGIVVANVFAYRATDPRELNKYGHTNDIVGPYNSKNLIRVIESADIVVAAWGAARSVKPWVKDFAIGHTKHLLARHVKRSRVMCLGRTKDGSPAHPLFLPADSNLSVFIREGNEDAAP